MPRQYTYGPFQSRRLKLSLGVDVIPQKKICTYDCVYCEIGPTGSTQLVSPDYRIQAPPSANFRQELKDILKYVPHLSSITFGYSGEPTLNENLLDFLRIAKSVREQMSWTNEPPLLTLFTNSSTLPSVEIRDRVKEFDLVLAKLDAATKEDFLRTNRPHRNVPNIERIIDSLVSLREEMDEGHQLAIQCLIHDSYRDDFTPNDNDENINFLAKAISRIRPSIVQLYSIARTPAQYFVFAIDEEKKQEIVKKFKNVVNDETVKINYY